METRLLAVTSLLFLGIAAYAYNNGAFEYAALSAITGIISANYWRDATFDYRRVADLVFSKISFAIYFVSGFTFCYNTPLYNPAMVVNFCILFSYYMSFRQFRHKNPNWIYFHALFHCFAAIEKYAILQCYIEFVRRLEAAAAKPPY